MNALSGCKMSFNGFFLLEGEILGRTHEPDRAPISTASSILVDRCPKQLLGWHILALSDRPQKRGTLARSYGPAYQDFLVRQALRYYGRHIGNDCLSSNRFHQVIRGPDGPISKVCDQCQDQSGARPIRAVIWRKC